MPIVTRATSARRGQQPARDGAILHGNQKDASWSPAAQRAELGGSISK